jgi:hypothetical protein
MAAKATGSRRGDNHPIAAAGAPQQPPAPRARSGLLLRVAVWVVPPENPAGAVYGLLALGAVLAAESGRHETYLDTVLSALITGASYWLLHGYAAVLGQRFTRGQRLNLHTLATALAHGRPVLRGGAIPLAVLLIGWAAGAAQSTGVSAAVWTTVASLVGFELLAGIRANAGPREMVLEAGVGAVLGTAVLALRVVLH